MLSLIGSLARPVCLKWLVLGFGMICLSGCASFGIQALGGVILEKLGLGPKQSLLSSAETFTKATQELSREEEYYLGRAVAAKILAMYKPSTNAQLVAYINQVGSSVVAFSDQPLTYGGYHFMLLDSTEVNAMAAPGGFIFITTGLLELLPDEDALAAVLAHEVSHVTKQHGLKAISQANMTSALQSLGQLAGSFNCSEVLQGASLLFGSVVDDVVDTLVNKGYSRDQEFEADADAIELLNVVGFDTFSMVDLLTVLEIQEGDSHGGWFSTHPLPSERMTSVKAKLAHDSLSASTTGRVERLTRFEKFVRPG